MTFSILNPTFTSAFFPSFTPKPHLFSCKPSNFQPRVAISSMSSPQISRPKLQLSPMSFQTDFPYASQSPATAMRGAESDIMGLLLRERIVFLGSEINDFVADAIISQLLLLDAQDPTRDIRLFINSPGGSLRLNFSLLLSGGFGLGILVVTFWLVLDFFFFTVQLWQYLM